MEIRHLYLPVGLPAIGKTTLSKGLQQLYLPNVLYIFGPDNMREEKYPGYEAGDIPFSDIDNQLIFGQSFRKACQYLSKGDLWWDATNISRPEREKIIRFTTKFAALKGFKINIVAIDLEMPFDLIIERNLQCRKGHRCPPMETLFALQEKKNGSPVDMTEEKINELWKIQWEDKWVMAEGPPLCQSMIDLANAYFTN